MQKQYDHLMISPLNEALMPGDEGRPTSQMLRAIEQQHHVLSTQLSEYYSRRKSWLAQLFPTRLDRVLLDAQLNQARTECDLNERILGLACEMKYQACQEAADAWLKSVTVETRETFFRFVAGRLAKLQREVEQKRVDFAEHMRDRYATAEQFKSMPAFYDRYRRSIEEEIQATMTWLDGLLSEFRAIVQKRVTQYDQPQLTR